MPQPPPPPPPADLVEDVIGEILLRLPPDEPECLFRAALVCTPWLRTLSDPAFLRRYRAFHGTPPLHGLVVGNQVVYGIQSLWFVPTTAARAFPLPRGRLLEPDDAASSWRARTRDCRHGRVLIRMLGVRGATASSYWLVCDLVTGDRHRVPDPWIGASPMFNSAAAEVFCAASGCQHLDCHGGAFRVAILLSDYSGGGTMSAAVYSSENGGAWSAPATPTLQGVREAYGRAAIIADEIYFMLSGNAGIVKYDWVKNCLSVVKAPPSAVNVRYNDLALMVVEGSSLGVAGIEHSSLYLWSTRVSSEAAAEWVLCRVIQLDTVMPMVNLSAGASVVGFAEGVDVIFVGTHVGLFMMELKSGRVRKLRRHKFYLEVLPCMSFYTPDRCRVIR